MIRTLTLVSVLALVAGLAMGFFVAEARAKNAPSTAAPVNPVIEAKVAAYVTAFNLAPAPAQQIRLALLDYDERILAIFRKLRADHQEEFRHLAEGANEKIKAVLAAAAESEKQK